MTQPYNTRRELGVLLQKPWWQSIGHATEEAAETRGREHGSLAECRDKFDNIGRLMRAGQLPAEPQLSTATPHARKRRSAVTALLAVARSLFKRRA